MANDTIIDRRTILNIGGIQIVMFFITLTSFCVSLIDIMEPMYRFSFLQPLGFGTVSYTHLTLPTNSLV